MNLELVDIVLIIAVGGLIIAGIIFGMMFRTRRHRELMERAIPAEWETIMRENIALYNMLPDNLRDELKGRINIFLDEKEFEGCGGLEITDTVKVVIAAQACILLLNKNFDYYPKLNSVLVYPSAYVTSGASRLGNTVIHDEESARLGESWQHGNLVLAWDQVKFDAATFGKGHNVALHEFAHQLDQANGAADGIPFLGGGPEKYQHWIKVMQETFEELREEVKIGHHDIIDEYGATNPAEFFAVVTETFFSCPHILKKAHPELYGEFRDFYKLNPAKWTAPKRRSKK